MHDYIGDDNDAYYYLTSDNHIDLNRLPCNENEYKLYTIDEFWADFPYKVGDKVHILFKDKDAEVIKAYWTNNMECMYYDCLYDINHYVTTRAEDLIPIETEPSEADTKDEPINIAEILKDEPKGTKLYCSIFGDAYFDMIKPAMFIQVRTANRNLWVFDKHGRYHNNADVLLFPSRENRDWSTFKVEPEYPTTYEDCCDTLNPSSKQWRHKFLLATTDGYGNVVDCSYKSPYFSKLNALHKLLICRDAWWKVDNNWKPKWKNRQMKRGIVCSYNQITTSTLLSISAILAFRTKEIRDKFLETFRDLIEQCKELL